MIVNVKSSLKLPSAFFLPVWLSSSASSVSQTGLRISPDEQQALQQFPKGHPAGGPAAEGLQSQGRGGFGAVPTADPTRRLRDAAPRGWPQVVLWQLHLLSPTLAHPGYYYCWGNWSVEDEPKLCCKARLLKG